MEGRQRLTQQALNRIDDPYVKELLGDKVKVDNIQRPTSSFRSMSFNKMFIDRERAKRAEQSQIAIHDSASSLPPQGGKKETHTYKKKEYVVRTGEKGGRFILVGGKEKKKVYV